MLIVLLFGYYRESSVLRKDLHFISARCCIIADEFQSLGDMEVSSLIPRPAVSKIYL